MASPVPRSGIPRVSTSAGRYATQGMISPVEPPFVEPATGTLTPVSFRFLYGLYSDIQTLQAGGGGGGTVGPPGPQGPPGPTGPAGTAATVNVGTTTTGAAGTPASVTNSGSTSAAIFNFTVPQGVAGATGSTGPQGNPGATGATGPAGAAATITAGTTTTGAAGTSASVTNSGTSSAAVFDFTIPQGQTGTTGATGSQGPQGNPGATGPAGTAATVNVGTTTTGAAGSAANVTNSGSTSAAVFNFTIPQGIQGNTGPQGPNWQVGTGLTLNTGTTPNTVAMTSPTPASVPKAGVTDGSNAAAGQVGEYLTVSLGSVAMPNGGWQSIGSLALTAGDWDVWGFIAFSPTAAPLTAAYAGLGTASNTAPSPYQAVATQGSAGQVALLAPTLRFSGAAAMTAWLTGTCTYGSGGVNASGNIYARRVR